MPDRDPTQNPIRSERPTLPSRPREASEVERFTDSFEVVVVGLGVAGGAAAIEAARAGARTLVLERATRGGGATALSEGTIYFGGGTRVQQAAGFEDDLEKMMTHVRAAAGPSSDPEKVRLYCENSLDHFEFFCGLGVEFKDSFYPEKAIFPPTDDCLMFSGNEEAHPFSTESPPVPRGHKPRREGPAGGYIIERMIETLGELGVEIRNETRVETLVQDDDGRVIGVVARHGDEEIAIEATRGVILTTGGFIMNREMVEHFAPDLARCRYPIGSEGCDGSGIRMGIGVGGAAINMHEGLMTTPWYPPASHVRGLIVNARGQRFINEDCYHGRVADAVMHKADGRAYLVVDDATYGKTMIPYEMVAVEETIEALEKSLDMPEGQLVHTVATYNRDAGRGEDTLLHKASKYLQPLSQPPFAALDLSVDKCLWAAFTLGGLDTRPSGEVLTVDGEVVPGLYAAGRASAGLTRSGRYYASGMSIGGSSFFGRLAGRTAAKAAPR